MTESKEAIEHGEWSTPLPERVPRPTYFPLLFALGCVFILFGIVTSWVTSVVGGLLFAIAIIGWIGELRHEQR